MAKMWKDMTPQERANVVAGKVTDSTGGLDPLDPMYREAAGQVGQRGWNMPIERPVDPEADVNHQINERLRQPGVVIPPSSNGINPETGMPFFNKQAPLSPEDEERRQMNEFKLQYLKNKASGQQ